MSLYEVVCKMIKAGIRFDINFDGSPGIIVITVGNWSTTFTSEDFHKAAAWMHSTAFERATGDKEYAQDSVQGVPLPEKQPEYYQSGQQHHQ